MKEFFERHFTTDADQPEYVSEAEERMIIVMVIIASFLFVDSLMHGGLFTNQLAEVLIHG